MSSAVFSSTYEKVFYTWSVLDIDNMISPSKFVNFTDVPYRTKVRRTKFSTDKIFRRTKFSTPSRNFDTFVRFLPDFCIETLDKIFDGQNFSSDEILDIIPKFRQFLSDKVYKI